MVRTGNVDFSCTRLTSIEIRKSKYHLIRRVRFRWDPPPRKISGYPRLTLEARISPSGRDKQNPAVYKKRNSTVVKGQMLSKLSTKLKMYVCNFETLLLKTNLAPSAKEINFGIHLQRAFCGQNRLILTAQNMLCSL